MRKYSYLLSLFVALALTIVFTESSRAADPNDFRKPNQWQRERTINDAINKSSVKVEAQRTYPVSTLGPDGKPIKQMRNAKATITLGAKSANVGKSLMKRAPYTAISYAVVAILGRAVDWVLDPANNRVKYKDPNGDPPSGWKAEYNNVIYKSPSSFCKAWNADRPSPISGIVPVLIVISETSAQFKCNNSTGGNYVTVSADPDVEDAGEADWQYISADELANKVIEHANEGQAPAMQVMNDAALDALEAGLLDAQLDAASNVPQPDPQEITQAQYDNPDYPENGTGSGTGPETPVDPETPPDPTDPTNPEAKPFELPPFCSWATKVCSFIDWMQTEPPEPPEGGEVDIQTPDANMHEGILERLYIDMPAQCPPDPVLEFMGARIPFPMSVFCQFAAMMKPLILLFAYIKGLSIIGTGLS